jgi:hypothetical protein
LLISGQRSRQQTINGNQLIFTLEKLPKNIWVISTIKIIKKGDAKYQRKNLLTLLGDDDSKLSFIFLLP